MDILESDPLDKPENVGHRAVSAGVRPVETDVEQPATGSLAGEHHPARGLVAGLLELGRRDAVAGRGGIDPQDPVEQRIDIVRLAGELRDEQPGVEKVVVAEPGVLGQSGIDEFPVQPAARAVAEHDAEHPGGPAIGILLARRRCHPDGVAERRRRPFDPLQIDVGRGAADGDAGPRPGRHRLPIAAQPSGLLDECGKVDGAAGGQHHAGR